MNNMKYLLIVITTAALLTGCSDTPTHSEATNTAEVVPPSRLSRLGWMLGEWQAEMPEGVFTEKWQKETDTSYSGEGVLIARNGEVLFTEQLRVEQRDGVIWYMPTIASQNNGKPVLFKEKTFTDEEIVFENPEHDFPQRITYRKPTDNTLYARVEGKQKGKDAVEEFNFKRK
jgi:hypothetical protein